MSATPDPKSTEQADDPLGTRRILTMVRWLLYLVFLVIGYVILRRLAPVLTPILAAGGIAYLLDPLVDKLEARGMKRVLAVTLLLILFLGSVTLSFIILIPIVAEDVAEFITDLPVMVESTAAWVAHNFGYELPSTWQEYMTSDEVTVVLRDALGPAAAIATAAVGGVFSLLGFLAELLLIPVFAFYFLLDWSAILARGRAMIPPRHRALVVDIIIDIDDKVSSWLRGQFTVTAILAVLYAISFYFIDIQLAAPAGILVGLLTIIPFLGTFVGLAITLILIFVDWRGFGQLAAVGGIFAVLHLIEAAVLTPKIVGKKVGLGESGALFAVLAGGQLLGFAGVLLAVPLAASVAVLLRRAMSYYERSVFFGANDMDGSLPAPVVEVKLPETASGVALPEPPKAEKT